MRRLRIALSPAVLLFCGIAAGCTSTQTGGTLSMAPTAEPMLPDTVDAVPFGAAGSTEDGLRSLAHEVEVDGGASPAAYAAPDTNNAVAAVQTQAGTARIATVPVPPGVETAQAASAETAPAETQPQQLAMAGPSPSGEGKSLARTVIQAPVNAVRATAATVGAAVLPASLTTGDDVEATRPVPEERVGPAVVEARSPELDDLMRHYANYYGVPEELVRRVAKRESTFNPRARNGRYLGLMQIAPATARGMGYRGTPGGLLDAETNLKYAVRYLRGAYVVARGNHNVADKLYQTGYYYHAKRAGLLDETGVGTDRKWRRRL